MEKGRKGKDSPNKFSIKDPWIEEHYSDIFDEDYKDVIDACPITPRIYLGSYRRAAKQWNGLKLLGITHILTVGNDMSPAPFPLDFSYKIIKIDDHPDQDISKYFVECLEFLSNAMTENSTNKVLIHCMAGISRSATITIAYLMTYDRLSYIEAIERVRQRRWWIHPNRGFRKHLYQLSKVLQLDDDKETISLYEKAFRLLRKHNDQSKGKLDPSSERDFVIQAFVQVFGHDHPNIYSIKRELNMF